MSEASRPASPGKVPLRERILLLWDRALEWMHVYLAFDVHPRPRAPVDIHEVASPANRGAMDAEESLPSASWRSVGQRTGTRLATIAAGEWIADTYQVVRLIAAGDISSVYLVRHRHWNIDLALRVPDPQLGGIAGARRQFAERAEQWIALGVHPNIAPCFHIHSLNGVPLVLSEFVEGVTLRAWLAGEPEDGLRHGLDVAIQVCRALEHAHARGIAHGACTPDNIIIAAGGVPKLVDFGLPLSGTSLAGPATLRVASAERDIGEAYALSALMRAAPYVAPERWRQPTVIAPTGDVFALGVCLWEVFGGVRPYASTAVDAPRTTQEPHLGDDDARTRLALLLQRCVAWDAARRPPGVGEIRAELSAIYEMLFHEAHASGAPESTEADRLNAAAVTAVYGGKSADAERAWEAALALNPEHLDSLFNRAVTHWRQGMMTDEALAQQIENTALPRSESWKLRWLLGLVHLERGDLAAAEAVLEQALREQPDAVEVTQGLERVRLRSGSTPGAALAGEHSACVTAAGVSADGKIALAACDDATATVWDVSTGQCLQVLEGHLGGVAAAVLSADGRAALTGGNDGTIRVWDVPSGVCQRVFAGESGRIASLSVSPDGRLLLWAAHRSSEHIEGLTMQLWDTRSGECRRIFEGHAAAIKSVFLSVDGRYALSGGDDHLIRLWDVETGACVKTFTGHTNFVSGVCMSTDGALVLSASWDRTLRVWDRHTGRCVRVLSGHEALVAAACLSADAVWAASGGWDGTVRLWEVGTGRCLRTIHVSGGLLTSVAMSANGDRLVCGSWDGILRSWDVSPESREACRLRTASA
jgi:serine/threonine protein kinase